MKLQLVTFNNHHKINRCLLYFSYLTGIVCAILHDRYNNNIFIWLFVIVVLINIIHRGIFEAFTVVGKCSIDLHSACLKFKERLVIIEFSEINFIYGGYEGKDDGFNALFTGSNVKTGANNYLIFKKDSATKVQIMLNSKKEYKELLDKLTELEESGVKVQKTRYSVFEFRNIMKKLTLFF